MRIIFLNIWHGGVWGKLEKFLLSQAEKTNVFCFLEVDPPSQMKLKSVLRKFIPIYEKGAKVDYLGGVTEGRAVFVGEGIGIKDSGKKNIYRVNKKDAGGFQYVELDSDGKHFFVGSIHGKARPGHKKDTKVRVAQSRIILDFFKGRDGPKVIGGDFNLRPDTRSIKLFEEAGYRNLIKEFKIKRTRNRLAWEQFYDGPGFVKQYFADYCFVSPEVKVKNFEVPNIEISDHLPLILDFEV